MIRPVLESDIFEQVGESGVSVVDPDKSRGKGLLWLKSLVYEKDAGLSRIDILFIFRIGIEAELSGFPVFNLS